MIDTAVLISKLEEQVFLKGSQKQILRLMPCKVELLKDDSNIAKTRSFVRKCESFSLQ